MIRKLINSIYPFHIEIERMYDKFVKLPIFIKYCFKFRKMLSTYEDWNNETIYKMLRESIKANRECFSRNYHNFEIEYSKNTIKDMTTCIDILNNRIDEDYVGLAENELGYTLSGYKLITKKLEDGSYEVIETRTKEQQKRDSNIFKLASVTYQKDWNMLWKTLKGDRKCTRGIEGWWV